MRPTRCTALLIASLLTLPTRADTIHVAVASNFTAPMEALAERFEADSGHDLVLSSGSSGKLYAQIRNGAPYALFFSADQAKPDALIEDGLAIADSRFTYAIGALALWSADPARIKDGEATLRAGEFRRLALANPRLAPYGEAAVETLENLGLLEETRSKWVRGENIAQTYQFVGTGNAEIGFVALSQILSGGEFKAGSGWIVPPELYSPIRQDAVLLRHGQDNAAAQAFLAYFKTDSARAVIESHGYRTEDGVNCSESGLCSWEPSPGIPVRDTLVNTSL